MNTFLGTRTGLLAFLLLLASAQAAPNWSRLREGMSMAEAIKCLGEPLIRTRARGLERWIYDGAGEVVFFGGPLRAWTVASPAPDSLARPVEADVLFRPLRPARPRAPQPPPANTADRDPGEGGRFRNQ